MKKRKKINFTKSRLAGEYGFSLINFFNQENSWDEEEQDDYSFYNHSGIPTWGFLTIDKERYVALAMCFQDANWKHITKIIAVKEDSFFRNSTPLELTFDSGLDRAWANSVPLGEADITINF